jgi:hypothetical protein
VPHPNPNRRRRCSTRPGRCSTELGDPKSIGIPSGYLMGKYGGFNGKTIGKTIGKWRF